LSGLAVHGVGTADEPLIIAVGIVGALEPADTVEAVLVVATAVSASVVADAHALAALVTDWAVGVHVTFGAFFRGIIGAATHACNRPRERTDEEQEASRSSMLRYDHSANPGLKVFD
jgi:hypothetical protein